MLKELYWRLVNAITMLLAIHFPKVFLPALLDTEGHPLLKHLLVGLSHLDGPEAVEFSSKFNYALLNQLFDSCPPGHIICCVRRLGFPGKFIDIQPELDAAYQLYLDNCSRTKNYDMHYPGNCQYPKTRESDHFPGVFLDYFMVSLKGRLCYPFEQHLRTRVSSAVSNGYATRNQGLNLIIGWEYRPMADGNQA